MERSALQRDVESVSKQYASKFDIERTDDWFVLELTEGVGELAQAYLALSSRARDKCLSTDEMLAAFTDELADVLENVLPIAERFGVELDEAMQRKWLAWLPPRS